MHCLKIPLPLGIESVLHPIVQVQSSMPDTGPQQYMNTSIQSLNLNSTQLPSLLSPWVSSFQRKISMGQSGIEHGSHEHLSEAHEIDHN